MDPLTIYRRDIARYRTSDDLVLRNLALAVWLAGRFARPGIAQADLIGAANVGLLKARARYDDTKGPFASFAYVCIRSAIKDELRRLSGALKVPQRFWRRNIKRPAVSLEWAAGAEGAGELAGGANPADEAEHADDLAQLPRAIGRLAPRAQRIIQGLAAGKSGQRVGDELGISRERVRQIKCRSFAELRAFYLGDAG